MFTINQIKEAHSKVKSGADFPKYIQEMKQLGVNSYEHYVSNGHINYYGADGFTISADAKWADRSITDVASLAKLNHSLKIHQKGQTDYPTFCLQAAEAGIEKWVVDAIEMTCIYYDKAGNKMLTEEIPQ
jgi:uncharacterized protein YbcV (DUF1398 family)